MACSALEGEGLACLLPLSCLYALLVVFQMLLKHVWGSFPVLSKRQLCWDLPHQARGCPLFFLSFLLMLVVRVPKHEQEEYEGDY